MNTCTPGFYAVKDLSPHPENAILYVNSIDDHYHVGKELGKGYSATVFEAVHISTGTRTALKKIAKERQLSIARESYFRDVYNYLWQLPYEHGVRIQNVLEDEKHFYVAVDRCEGVDLVQFVLKFPPGSIPIVVVQKIMRSLLKSVNHLHCHQILHRDIKLDNVMLRKQEDPKNLLAVDSCLIDYDMCMFLNRSDLPKEPVKGKVSVVGTREYMAPESYRGIYLPQSDLWSCGVIMYLVMDGHFPFDLVNVKDHSEARQVVLKGIKKPSKLMDICPEAADLIMKLLEPNFYTRIPTAADALAHPFISKDFGNGSDNLGSYILSNAHLFPHLKFHRDLIRKLAKQQQAQQLSNSHKKEEAAAELAAESEKQTAAALVAQQQAALQEAAAKAQQQKNLTGRDTTNPSSVHHHSSTLQHHSSFKPSNDLHMNHHHGQHAFMNVNNIQNNNKNLTPTLLINSDDTKSDPINTITSTQPRFNNQQLEQNEKNSSVCSPNMASNTIHHQYHHQHQPEGQLNAGFIPQVPSTGAISKRSYIGAPYVVLHYNESVVSGVQHPSTPDLNPHYPQHTSTQQLPQQQYQTLDQYNNSWNKPETKEMQGFNVISGQSTSAGRSSAATINPSTPGNHQSSSASRKVVSTAGGPQQLSPSSTIPSNLATSKQRAGVYSGIESLTYNNIGSHGSIDERGGGNGTSSFIPRASPPAIGNSSNNIQIIPNNNSSNKNKHAGNRSLSNSTSTSSSVTNRQQQQQQHFGGLRQTGRLTEEDVQNVGLNFSSNYNNMDVEESSLLQQKRIYSGKMNNNASTSGVVSNFMNSNMNSSFNTNAMNNSGNINGTNVNMLHSYHPAMSREDLTPLLSFSNGNNHKLNSYFNLANNTGNNSTASNNANSKLALTTQTLNGTLNQQQAQNTFMSNAVSSGASAASSNCFSPVLSHQQRQQQHQSPTIMDAYTRRFHDHQQSLTSSMNQHHAPSKNTGTILTTPLTVANSAASPSHAQQTNNIQGFSDISTYHHQYRQQQQISTSAKLPVSVTENTPSRSVININDTSNLSISPVGASRLRAMSNNNNQTNFTSHFHQASGADVEMNGSGLFDDTKTSMNGTSNANHQQHHQQQYYSNNSSIGSSPMFQAQKNAVQISQHQRQNRANTSGSSGSYHQIYQQQQQQHLQDFNQPSMNTGSSSSIGLTRMLLGRAMH